MDKPSPETIQQRPRAGATRCPYCHDECEAGQDACACADCLSRHHTSCWDEASGCSSCRSTSRLSASATEEVLEEPRYGEVIDVWLKLGLAYNLSLALLTILLLGEALTTWKIGVQVLDGAFLANLGFLLGPMSELAARRAGFRRTRAFRWTVFGLGFGLSLLLALGACLSLAFTGPG